MPAYHKVEVSLNTNAVEVGVPEAQTVNVVLPLVGPQGETGPQGPAGEGGASTWNDISGKPSTFPPSAHASSHATGGSDPITPSDIGAATTESTVAAAKALADEYTGNPALIYTSEGSNGWTTLTEPASFRTALELGTAATADSTDFAPAVNVIELTPSPGSNTITTSQLPARGIAYAPTGETTYTVNLPTPDIRQSGLTFSIKTEYEEGSGVVFITVVHNASDLLTGYELDENESSLDFLWDGYRWTYSSANWLYSYPNRRLVIPPLSGTLGLAEPADNVFRVVGSTDATKKVAFEVDGISAGTTRTLTVANRSGTVVVSDTSAGGGSDVVNNIVSLTQAEYNAIGSPDATTLYLITDP